MADTLWISSHFYSSTFPSNDDYVKPLAMYNSVPNMNYEEHDTSLPSTSVGLHAFSRASPELTTYLRECESL